MATEPEGVAQHDGVPEAPRFVLDDVDVDGWIDCLEPDGRGNDGSGDGLD